MENINNVADLTGRKVKMQMDHLFQKVFFTAVIVADKGEVVVVEIPRRIRELQWSTLREPKYRYKRDAVLRALIA